MDRYIGKRLDGRYEIREVTGVGGMANVYKAYDLVDKKVVAVKILRDEYMNNEEFIRRFKNESKAIAVLSHPNIVKVYDVSFTPQVQSIVMEYIDGITLKEYIEQQKVIGWKEAVYFTVQILRALQHAHSRGIVHRDIKPHNIMLLADGTIKVMDFGIARFARSDSCTLTDKAIGSVHYISPEQAQGGVINNKTDIYSVGVMLFEMLTGQLPFDADSPVSVAIKQIQSEAVRPRSLNSAIPQGLEDITIRAMQKDPAQRYQSASEMLADLDVFKRDQTARFPSVANLIREEADNRSEKRQGFQTPAGPSAFPPAMQRGDQQKIQEPEEVLDLEDEEEVVVHSHTIPILSGIALAFVLVTAFLVFSLIRINKPFERVEEIPMPSLVGLKYEDIIHDERYAQFDIQVDGEPTYHESYEKGRIYDQLPKEGKSVKVNTIVKVKVSSGTKMLTIPSFAKQEATLVYNQIKNMGLEYTTLDVNDESIPKGYVVRTVPDKDTSVPAGTVVTVYVSLGSDKKMVDVPDVVGLNIKNAETLLNSYGLKVGNISQVASDKPSGTVVAQNPEDTVQLLEGSSVDLNVSKGRVEPIQRTMAIKLPDIEELVTVSATQDGTEVHRELVVPSELDGNTWMISFEGDGTAKIVINIEGKLYKEFALNFEENSYRTLTDRSEDFAP